MPSSPRVRSKTTSGACYSISPYLETGDCKTREIVHFPPFLLRSLTGETGYNQPELDFVEGPCILTESEGLFLNLVL